MEFQEIFFSRDSENLSVICLEFLLGRSFSESEICPGIVSEIIIENSPEVPLGITIYPEILPGINLKNLLKHILLEISTRSSSRLHTILADHASGILLDFFW